MDRPTVSVVVPVYNDGDVVSTAIESVLAQTYEEFELIVIDDGSSDETEVVVERYEDDRIHLVQHSENRGMAAARNTGIDAAKGEYIAFLDADDEWIPEKLQMQVDCLISRSEDWVGVYCDIHRVTTRRRQIERKIAGVLFHRETVPKEGGEELIKYVLIKKFDVGSDSTLLVRADTIKKLDGFDTAFPRHVGPEFIIRMLRQGKLAYVDRPLVEVHSHSDPDMETVKTAKRMYLEKFEEIIEELEADGYDIRKRHLLQIPRRYFEYGQFRNGFAHLSPMFFTRPSHVLRLIWSFGVGILKTLKRK